MPAVIHVDLTAVHPVIDGFWHRTRLTAIPDPGQPLIMLCGIQGAAAFEPVGERTARGVPHQCPRCETIYRQERGMTPSPIRRSPS